MTPSLSALLVAGFPLLACQCSDPKVFAGGGEGEGGGGSLDSSSDDTSSTTDDGATTRTTDPPVDVSRFIGNFHNELALTPFGREVEDSGDPTLANLEILPDGTAHMTMETCSELFGTLEISLRWEARPGPMLEFFPGPGEDSLRFMASSDLESVVAKLGDDCDILFEIDGEPLWMEPFRPGRACWVNRCMPAWTFHIDYCDGEAPPPCE